MIKFLSFMTPSYEELSKDRIEREKRSPFGFFITRTRLSILLIAAIVFGGFFALFTIPREADPEVKIPIAVVTTVYPGAGPADVESLITDEIEQKLEDLDDVKLITSSSSVGISSVVVEFDADADLKESIRELKDKVLEVKDLPSEAENPIVTEIRVDDQPIVTFSIAGDVSRDALEDLAETIDDELESIAGVSDVIVVGDRVREFSVEIDRGALQRTGIPLAGVIGAIRGSNFDMPLGSLDIEDVNYNLRTVSKFTRVEDIEDVVLADIGGGAVFVRDVARVSDTFADQKTRSRISLLGEPAIPTISLQVFKRTGGNIIDIVDTAKSRINTLTEDGTIPACCSVEVTSDYSHFIRKDLRTLGTSGIFTVILIFLILWAALNLRESLMSLIAVPLTFLITFFILNASGYTLNSLTLFSLVLSLGLLVDTFIVVMEGVFHNLRKGYKARDAGLLSVSHYKKPLIAGVFTTISAFVPMLLVSGILGEFLKVLPITISITLLSSLFVSLVIVPMLSGILLKRSRSGQERKHSLLERYVTNRLGKWYYQTLRDFLGNRKKKKRFSLLLTFAFLVSFVPLATGLIPVQLFPKVDVDFTFIDVELPIGSTLDETDVVVSQVEEYLYTRDDVKSFVTSIGRSSSFGFDGGGGGSSRDHLAHITVNLKDLDERDKKSFDINDEIKKDLLSVQGAEITVREISAGPPTGVPIEARITGSDLSELSGVSEALMGILRETEGVIDVESDESVSPAEFTFTLKRDAIAKAALSISDVSSFLRAAVNGLTATGVTLEGDDIDVVVRFDEDTLTSVDDIRNLTITNPRGEAIKIAALADITLEPALATIRHRDYDRTITVRANLETGFSPKTVVPQVEDKIAELDFVPDGYSLSFGGEVEDIDQSFAELWSAMIVAVLLIITILVLQFDSFLQPFAIIMTLPLMLIGVVFGMLVLHLPFSFSTFLGIVSLAGIVVNDAIVLLDKANRNIKELGMSTLDAVADAGVTRLQPIILTSVTTVVGVIPLAIADEFWFGLSTAIAFGLTFATVLTLGVVPMLYLKFLKSNR